MHAFMCFIFLYVTHLTSGQFPEHIDLQKVSEIIFRNETYNVFKPKVHIVRDHFKDFIQKRNNVNFPTNRVFLDRNGFRHFWKDLEILKTKNLRKAHLSEKEITLNIDKKQDSHKSNSPRVDTNVISKKNDTTIKIKDKPRRKKRLEAGVYTPAKPYLRDNSVIVKTTFFCPFFGVIRMSTNIENFDQ